jgi:hypothetical protein
MANLFMGWLRKKRKKFDFQAYNQRLWALIGTLAVGGFLLVFGGIALAVMADWLFSPDHISGIETNAGKDKDGRKTLKETAVLGKPMFRKASNLIAFPVFLEKEMKKNWETSFRFAPSSSDYGDEPSRGHSSWSYGFSGVFNNILFFDPSTGASRLLLDRRVVLQGFYQQERTEDDKPSPFADRIFFGMIDRDTNGDGLLNSGDAVVLHLVRWGGRDPIPLTPRDAQFDDLTLDHATKRFFIRVKADSNGDKKYDEEDPYEVHWADLDAPAKLRKVLSGEIQRKLDGMSIRE